MKNKRFKRILSMILCLSMILSCFNGVYVSVSEAASGTEAVTTTDVEFHDGIDYEVTRTTRYIGNRTYSVQVDISADLSTYEHARIRTASRNGYVTIQETGYYLIEMWGGDGGDGQMGWTVALIPVPTEGGNGANGGYVYGKVFLRAGQTLVYNIGTNGDQSTIYNDEGGGVNGDGGTHGDQGSYTVGGGGGYTAIYLFDVGEFDESYVTETAVNIPETARLSRYLMIAGGGGGGGAGYTNLISNGGVNGAPHGGMGGNINNGISMSLTGDDYLVPGYVFSGRNGQSSGTSTTYVGRGGSNVPGAVSETLMGYFTQNQLPNDWTGTHNPSVAPGAGGSGNFRGGGGGSGYAGGSGGIMAAQLIAANVGGGGGGSSFIAAEVNDKPIVFQDLTEGERAYLSGANAQPVGANTGGAVQITYLSGEEDEFHQEALDNITVAATVSRYFDVLSSSKTTGSDPLSITVNGDETTYVKATGLSIIPTSPAHSGKTASVTLFIRAKEEFMGGNSVQLIDGVSADFLSPNDNATPIHIVPSDLKAHKYVNVPLNATVQTNSYTSSQEGKSYATTSLYEDDYASVRSSLTSYWQYDHISAISTYRVYQNGTQITSASVAPAETTNYEVQYDVTPLISADPEVTVGPAIENPTTITGKAVISVVAPGTAMLNGLTVTGAKNLSYGDGAYTFSTIIDQQSENLTIGGETTIIGINDNPEWSAPEDGWYYVEAWGGDGGNGGSVSFSWNYQWYNWGWKWTSGSTSRNGGTGGSGGNVSTYVYLQKGETLSVNIGTVGASGSTDSYYASEHTEKLLAESGGGDGGNPTTVYYGDDTLLIAGGGGGGGGTAFAAKTAQFSEGLESIETKTGNTGNSPSTTVSTLSGTFNGGSGGAADASWPWTGKKLTAGSAGSAGVNYKNSAYGTTQSGYTLSTAAQKYAQETINTTKTGTNGQVAITLIENAEMEDVMETVKGLETKVAFSRYFNIDAVNLDVGTSYSSKSVVENADGSKTVTYTHSTYGQIAQFTYKMDTVADGSTVITISNCDYTLDGVYANTGDGYSMHYTAHLNFSYTLTPKDGFLGGNDVPVLAYGQYAEENAGLTGGVADKDTLPDCSVRVAQGAEFMNLPAANPTDFANVEHTVDMVPYLTVQDKTIHLGDSVEMTELYTFTPPTYGEDAWEDDYAYFTVPGNETYSPTQTTEYTITVGFAPRIATAQKATIVESLSAQEHSLTATVYVEVPVTASLTNLTCDNVDWTLWGESFGCIITPTAGYILPEEITVTINGEETNNYTYNETAGTVSIEGQYVTGPIVITAKAAVKTYDIHILYTNYDSTLGQDVLQTEVVITGIEADEEIDWSQLEAIKDTINEKTGYNYQWVFETADGLQPTTMPANNLWVYGSYEKASYQLTINYVYENGTLVEGVDSYIGSVVYGDSYSVVSPAVKGYLPDQTVVSGTMGAEAVTVTVTYTPSKNKLIILYQKKSDGTLLDRYEQDTVTSETYTVNSPEIEGYETDTPVVTVTMEGDDTQTIIVKYTPKTYTVTFDYTSGGYDSATLDGASSKLVEYDNIYSYNAANKIYDGLPTAQIAGYTFVGWFTEPECVNEVKESDTVKLTADTTLYAKWERTKFKLTVRYQFLYEDSDYIPEGYDSVDAVRTFLVDNVQEIEYGAGYSVTLPVFVGYSAYQNYALNDQAKLETLTGTMPGQNLLVVITYEINTYTINFMDLSGSHVNYSDKDTSTVATDSFDTVWKTVYVKHNVVPVYEETDPTPNHAMREEYTYTFTGWYGSGGSDDGVAYSGKTPTFSAATSECNYYAMYDATENIVAVTCGSNVEYFTNVASALEFAEANISSGVVMKFRRNAGNERVLNLNDDTLVFGNTYTGTTSYTVTIDLNGLRLENTSGQPLVENTLEPLNLVIQDSDGGGSLSVTGGGDVVAVKSSSGNLTVAENVIIEAQADNGAACGIEVSGTSTVTPAMIMVVGKNAVGIRVAEGAPTLVGTVMELNVSGTENAMGIQIAEGATLVNTVSNETVRKVTSRGNAYGIYNEGTLSSLNLKMTVEAANNAYGLYNKAGAVTVTGIGRDTDLRAASESGQGYGLFNVKDGTTIGAADGDKLSTGAFAGSSYGIYSEDSSIYASGNFVYFKGADTDSALYGVVYDDEEYDEVDATEQFEEGYYRLAALRTITFVTNGGTEIKAITLYFDELIYEEITTTKSGYTFDAWYEDEALQQSTQIPERMPEKDLTIYAKWSLNTYYYSLDKEFKEVKIYFNYRQPVGTTTVKTVMLTKDNQYLELPPDGTFNYNSYLYVQSGWYTSTTPSYSTRVDFSGDISRYAAYSEDEGCYVINFYGGWEKSSSTLYSNSSSYYEIIGTDSANPATARITSSYQSTSAYYMYYQVPASGDYTLNIKNTPATSSGTSKYAYAYKYVPDSSTSYNASTYQSISANSTWTYTFSNMNPGDVIIVKLYRTSSNNTASDVSCHITTTADLVAEESKQAYSIYYELPIVYNVEMGTVTLPVADSTDHEDQKFAGWAENEAADRIMQITPDMVDTVPQWSGEEKELWQLYSQWTERTWAAYQSGQRDFSAFEKSNTVTIRNDETVSVRFTSEQAPTAAIVFKFANGLPAGTILTLIDRSGSVPVYYTYTVQGETITELSSTEFVKMGDKDTHFSGYSTDVILQICYQNAELTAGTETISIFAGDIVAEVDVNYSIYNEDEPQDLGDVSFAHTDNYTATVTVPQLTDKNLNPTDKVFLRIRWEDLNLAPGSSFIIGEGETVKTAAIYDGEYAIMDTGMTVADLTNQTAAALTISLPTMVQNEFENKTFYYEICVAPSDTDAVFGQKIKTVYTYTQKITLTEDLSEPDTN